MYLEKGDPAKSGYLNFDPGGMSKINWRPTGVQVSESRKDHRSDPSSEPGHKPIFFSDKQTPEESCKNISSQTNNGIVSTRKETQEVGSTRQLSCQYRRILIHIQCEGNGPIWGKFGSYLPPSRRRDKSIGWEFQGKQFQKLAIHYWIHVVRDDIFKGRDEINTYPHKISSWNSMRWQQQHSHLAASEPNHNPKSAPISVSGKSAPGFGYSSGYSSGSSSDNPIKDPSPVPITNPASVPSSTSTKYTSHVPN